MNTQDQGIPGGRPAHSPTASAAPGPSNQIEFPAIEAKLVGFSDWDLNARPFKLLRTTLARQMDEHKCQVIGVTSASPHAGKSFIASNLAASMSRIAKDGVILADLDLQRATIAEVLGMEAAPGVAEYLSGEVDSVGSIAWQVVDTGLTIVPTHLRSVNSAALMASERFVSLIAGLRQLGPHATIICDLPPLFVSDDTMLASQHLDGVLVVVEQGVTTKKQLEASLQMLYPAKVLGTVVNRYTCSYGDPYGYSGAYGSYYK